MPDISQHFGSLNHIATACAVYTGQNADVMPAIENGSNAERDQRQKKRNVLPKDVFECIVQCQKHCKPRERDDSWRGSALISDYTGFAAMASRIVRLAPITLVRSRLSRGPASGAPKIARPVRATIAACPSNNALTTELMLTTIVARLIGTF